MPKQEAKLAEFFYVDDSEIHGLGLFARTEIEKGVYLGDYDGPLTKENGSHVLWVETEEGDWVGRDGKNILRYLNHSENPCCEFEGFELYAVRKITPGEEVTIDYGEDPAE